jgi:hypothetical protein
MPHARSLAVLLACAALTVARPAMPRAASEPARAQLVITQKYLTPVCLDGVPDVGARRQWPVAAGQHVVVLTMRNAPRPGIANAAPGVAAVRFDATPGHRYEVEIRASAWSFSQRVWSAGEWTPVVRDRSVDRIVSGAPDWHAAGCQAGR